MSSVSLEMKFGAVIGPVTTPPESGRLAAWAAAAAAVAKAFVATEGDVFPTVPVVAVVPFGRAEAALRDAAEPTAAQVGTPVELRPVWY